MGELWRVGRLLRPWGRRGEWLLAADGDDPARFAPGRALYLRMGAGDPRPVTVASFTIRGENWMIGLEPADAGARDAELLMRAEEIGDDPADPAPWLHDLLGSTLLSPEGRALGVIAEYLEGPAHPLLRISTPRGSRLVPFVEAYEPRFDRAARTLTLTLPDGLLDETLAIGEREPDADGSES